MKMTAEAANKVFDILETKGNHKKSYIDSYRADFVHYMETKGAFEHWYPSECGSSIKIYFNFYRRPEITIYAQTINDINEPTLVADVTTALNELTATFTDADVSR